MKKTVAICSVILSVAIIFTVFTSCGKKEEEVSDGKTFTAENGDVYSAQIGDSNAVIMINDEVYQTLNYPNNPGFVFVKDYAQEHYEFIDMNFDGIPDFYVAACKNGEDVNYFCWLFNDTTKEFDYSVSLSALKNISVDSYNQRILSTVSGGENPRIASYQWVNGVLTFEKEYGKNNETVPEEIKEIVSENVIGVETTAASKTTTSKKADKTEDTTKKDSQNQTTTKKNSNNSSDKTTEKADNTTTTKRNKPLATTTTQPAVTQRVEVATGDDAEGFDDGWF
ncbi:MAG: XAC2610-related protein [Acutalibacteraceae bacterium]